jgi:hypothetical protein
VKVEVEDGTEGLVEWLIREAADVAGESEEFAEGEGVGETAGGEFLQKGAS